jgi:gag-polypeptide of LTR copia-type/Zinc knuckle
MKIQIEDILYYKDLYEPVEGESVKPEEMTTANWNKWNRKAIGTIRQWLDDNVYHHVASETNAHELWKKLESLYEQKTTANKAFLIRKLVNLKFRESTNVAEHLNEFQSLINQLSAMKMTLEDELQALLLLGSLPDSWETLVVTISNAAPNGVVTMSTVTSSLFNEETRRKSTDTNGAQALVTENRGRAEYRQQSRGRSKSRGKSKSKGRQCYHCGKEGHIKRNCRAWKRLQNEGKNQKK